MQNLPQKRLGRDGGEDADEDADMAAADHAGPSGSDQAGPSRDPGEISVTCAAEYVCM